MAEVDVLRTWATGLAVLAFLGAVATVGVSIAVFVLTVLTLADETGVTVPELALLGVYGGVLLPLSIGILYRARPH